MLQERLYIPFKWAMFLSFADVMCFFISVYLLIRVSEKCQNILFLLLKRREKQDFHRCGIPSNFSFPKLSFIESHTIISEVCFNNREFYSLLLGVIWGVILNFLSTFSVYYFALMSTIFIIQCIICIVLGFILSYCTISPFLNHLFPITESVYGS